jgi:hypothetical protein
VETSTPHETATVEGDATEQVNCGAIKWGRKKTHAKLWRHEHDDRMQGRIFPLFLSRSEGGLRGHKNIDLFKRAVEEVFLINSLNFNLRNLLREL